MKNTLIILGIIILVASGYFFFSRNKSDVKNNTSTEEPVVSGKLDINAICEGALSYMTFASGEEADKFVAECKEGKHPEVIEKFKVDMGLGDGASI